MMLMKDFKDEFQKLRRRIFILKTPTAFARYGDGEHALITGREVGAGTQAFVTDKWSAPSLLTLLGEDLKESLQADDPDYFYGVPSPAQNSPMFLDYKEWTGRDEEALTFADLWVNSNHRDFLSGMREIKEKAVLICSKEAEGRLKGFPFAVSDYVPVPGRCVEHWEKNRAGINAELSQLASSRDNSLFLLAAGPLSEVMISTMHRTNPSNRYIDVGSGLDLFVHGRPTRPYMNPESRYYHDSPLWRQGPRGNAAGLCTGAGCPGPAF